MFLYGMLQANPLIPLLYPVRQLLSMKKYSKSTFFPALTGLDQAFHSTLASSRYVVTFREPFGT